MEIRKARRGRSLSSAIWTCARSWAARISPSRSWTSRPSARRRSRRAAGLRNLDESDEINACSIVDRRGRRREDRSLASDVQKRNAQPPHRDRALRRRGHLPRRRDPRPAVRPRLRVPGHARDRRGRPAGARARTRCPASCRSARSSPPRRRATRPTATRSALPPGWWTSCTTPATSPSAWRSARWSARRRLRNVRRETPAAGRCRDSAGRAHRARRLRRGDRLLQEPQARQPRKLRRGGAEGQPRDERKLQRLFRDEQVTRLIKRCNDFGAGGVCVAIGELADGLYIDLDKVPKKYEGLDGTELAISECQERMAVVVAAAGRAGIYRAVPTRKTWRRRSLREVTAEPRLKMTLARERRSSNIAREFLNSNGASKHASAFVPDDGIRPCPSRAKPWPKSLRTWSPTSTSAPKRGFRSALIPPSARARVLMPFGGKTQLTPAQAMAAKLPVLHGDTDTCSRHGLRLSPAADGAKPLRGRVPERGGKPVRGSPPRV